MGALSGGLLKSLLEDFVAEDRFKQGMHHLCDQPNLGNVF
jgi:hypothetical protein